MKIKLNIDIDELIDPTKLKNLVMEQVYAMVRQAIDEKMKNGLPALSELYPCYKCNRRGDETYPVIDRQGYKNNPERFMHEHGFCPQPPDNDKKAEPFDVVDIRNGLQYGETDDGQGWC